MKPYQQRVVDEKAGLDEKLKKLQQFIGSPAFVSLDREEIERLLKQETYMIGYSNILGERIAAFNTKE